MCLRHHFLRGIRLADTTLIILSTPPECRNLVTELARHLPSGRSRVGLLLLHGTKHVTLRPSFPFATIKHGHTIKFLLRISFTGLEFENENNGSYRRIRGIRDSRWISFPLNRPSNCLVGFVRRSLEPSKRLSIESLRHFAVTKDHALS